MKLEVLNIQGQQTGREIELPEDVFGVEPNEHVVYLAVKQYLAAQRQGTHKAKERNEIAGSTKKLKRQKGTGTARFGDIKNPVFRGGGRIFGPRPRKYNITLNKKVKLLARKSALSSKASAGKIFVIEDFSFEAPKTKAFADILTALKVADQKPVVVTSDYEKEVYLSSRNLPKTKVVRASDLNTYEVMNAGALILSEGAVEKIKEAFAN
ncbi:50S ribosomal protein L4 [Phaeodactylibacter xiamenensis]|jgi:large subunit ribosomal protein L4|uniref:Large ribosomal subunit protein uL4 n=1 Tax=Phaeodactylibacter xiamenensis TaxID=1524460 RepID=A0A098S5Q5_9BACT|nr:50S ribosomal protein L4 [Phaeodactylibacter xiamenensis]KGE87440.1 50S ribosomal protein L4 [Phaeodactylibacter xiamenensis]MCR9055388.1 50S ribosomal protein L4 [bacterium]